MFEVYVLVKKKKPVFLMFFTVFSFVIGVLSALATMIGLYFFVPTAVFGIILGYFFYTRNYEYEYSFFDDDVRFAKIINKSSRKKLPGYKMSDVIAIAPAGDPSVEQYENDSKAKIRRLNSGFQNAKVFVMAAKGEKGLELVYFEPDDKYLDAVCVKNGFKVKR